MKKTILLLLVLCGGCRVYKEQSGKKVETWNYRHLKKIHKRSGGMWAGKKYIRFR